MAIIAPFLINFGVHSAIVILILGLSYFYLYKKDPFQEELKEDSKDYEVSNQVSKGRKLHYLYIQDFLEILF